MSRALVREGGTVSVKNRRDIEPCVGELVVATEVAGLCGTDLQMLRGLRNDPASVIGHEGICTVVAVGSGVPAELGVGARVTVNPTHPADPSFLLGHNLDGLLQERTLIPATAVTNGLVLPLPRCTDADLGAILEPLAVVRYALGELLSHHPETLIVVGDGTVGHLAVRGARRWLGPDVRTVLVHHTRRGLQHSVTMGIADQSILIDSLPALRWGAGPVAAMVVTPRTSTVAALEHLVRAAVVNKRDDENPLTVDLIGGLPTGARTPMLPGADLVAIRSAACAGVPSPAHGALVTSSEGPRVRVLGHRGVSNGHLLDAGVELARDPERYRPVITHLANLDAAAHIIRSLIASPGRVIDGRRLVKLAIRINPPSEL